MYIKRLLILITLLCNAHLSNGQGLVASFAVDGDTNLSVVRVCRGYNVFFNDVSTGFYTTRLWTFTGGSIGTSTSLNAAVNFPSNGNYSGSLQVSDTAGNTSTINFTVQVASNKPNVIFGPLTDACSSDPGFALNTGVPAGGYYFGSGVIDGVFYPAVADTGYHNLGYVYTSPNGCADTGYSVIYVKPGPKAELFEINNWSNCNGFSTANTDFLIEVFDLSTSPDSIIHHEIIWGDGTPDWDSTGFRTTGLQHTYYGQGIYNLLYIVTSSNGCTDTSEYDVLNTSNPASLNITNPGGTNGCAPVTVTFPLNTTNTDSTITYTIEWGDGKDTTFGHPPPAYISHTYDTTSCVFPGGFFNIIAIAENACITTQSTVAGPFVTQPAIAEFTPLSGCVGVQHQLPNLSIPGYSNACSRLTTFIWDFDDGTPPVIVTSMTPIPAPGQHIWTSPGIYNVQLIVSSLSGNCPGDTVDYDVCIEDVKQGNISFLDTIGCAPFAPVISNLTDTTMVCTPVSEYWFVDDSTGVTFNNNTGFGSHEPQIVFNQQGTYKLSYVVSNACNVDTVSQEIYVKGPPTVSFLKNVGPFCDTLNVNFGLDSLHKPSIDTNLASITSYNWSITPNTGYTYISGNSSSQYPSVRFTPGTYSVVHSATNLCGTGIDSQLIVVNALTNGGFNINVTKGCSPLAVSVQSTSTVGVSHKWIVNGQLYSTNRDTNFVFTNTGINGDSIYDLKLAVYSGLGCADTIRETVTVYPLPSTGFSSSDACIGDTIFFFDSTKVAYAPVVSYLWDFGDGNTSTIQNPEHYYTSPGRYYVSLSTLDTNGCSGYFKDTIWLKSKPLVDYTITHSASPDSVCILDSVFFDDISTVDINGTPIVSRNWDFLNDGTIDDTTRNASYIFTTPGSYQVKLTVMSQSGCIDTVVKTIHVSTPPTPIISMSQYSGCTPITIVASENSYGHIKNYYWDFYTKDSLGNVTHLYITTNKDPNPIPPLTATGFTNTTVFAKLTVSNDCYSAIAVDTISVIPVPIPYFAMSLDTGCSPLTITIQTDGVVSGQPDSIIFNYGDGSPTQKLMPLVNILPNGDTLYTWNQQQHTFTYNGNKLDTTYNITLRGINECGDSTFTAPIVVRNRSVQSFFNTTTNYGCAPLSVGFNDYSFASTIVSYSFDFDTINKVNNGAISSNRNPIHLFNQPGTYVIAQFVSNICGSDTSYQTIEVLPKPDPQISFASKVCAGDTVDFVNNTTLASGQIIGYHWYFGDGDSSHLLNPYHIYDTAGAFNVCLRVETDAGCDTTLCSTIFVNPKPTADYSFVNNLCLNEQPVQFLNLSTNPTGNIILYEWDFGDGNVSTLINPPHSYTQAGTYDVKLRVMNDDYCSDSITQQVTVLPIPTAGFDYSFVNGDSCGVPQVVDFTNSSNGAGGYYWDFDYGKNPGIYTSAVVHPSHMYTDPGTYRVMLVSSNGFSCSDTVFKDVVVHPVPKAAMFTSVQDGCMNLEVSFYNNTTLPIGFNDQLFYKWSFGDGYSSTAKDPVHVYKKHGKYSVTLSVISEYNCGDTLTMQDYIEVYPVPVPTYSTDLVEFGIYDFFQQSFGGTPPYTYYWDFGDGSNSTITNPQHVFNVTQVNYGNGYNVCLTVTDANGCDSTICDTLNIGAFTLYVPNAMSPATAGEASVFLPKGQGLDQYECQIFDRWGNLLWRSDKLDPATASPSEGWDGTYQGEPVPMGVYVWKIEARFENGGVWRRLDDQGNVIGNTGTITIVR